MAGISKHKEPALPRILFGYKGKAAKWETALTEDGLTAFRLLRKDLRETGGTLRGRYWPSFGKLNQLKDKPYHCHLNHGEVVVWQVIKQGAEAQCIFLYIGSRKDAPY